MTAKRRATKPAGKRAYPERRRSSKSPPAKPRFVGRDPSPVLDRYPPKDPNLSVRGPSPAAPRSSPTTTAPRSDPPIVAGPTQPAAAPSAPPASLISLERPFDPDEFSQMLGETTLRVTVPREDLGEALRRIVDFMGFGIYVYRFSVRPAPSDLLKQFVIELQRVDYSPTSKDWVEFEEKGRSESPFGPGSTR